MGERPLCARRRNALSHNASSAQARRAAITSQIQAETGIDEAMIERLVRTFYAQVREDAILGSVFAAKISGWEPHLQKMFAFWSSVALMSGRYHGQPTARHAPLPIDAQHFDRWLALFARTARRVCPRSAAERFILASRRIAESLELGLATAQGVVLGKGERYFAGNHDRRDCTETQRISEPSAVTYANAGRDGAGS